MERYGLVRDDTGIRVGKYIENWKELTTELEKEEYRWDKESRHFMSGNFWSGELLYSAV